MLAGTSVERKCKAKTDLKKFDNADFQNKSFCTSHTLEDWRKKLGGAGGGKPKILSDKFCSIFHSRSGRGRYRRFSMAYLQRGFFDEQREKSWKNFIAEEGQDAETWKEGSGDPEYMVHSSWGGVFHGYDPAPPPPLRVSWV